jgi:predicted Rossmann-fold nucleotide-binding protein
MDICTGCGPGAMKGPMKGAAVGHAKQRIAGRYLGLTEPGIIAAEAPNPIVNELVIFPDIEKRLEAFVRVGHGIIVFPGGVGTAEEILYLLGILLHPANAELPFPLIFTGPKSAEAYFRRIDEFIGATIGAEAQRRYKIIIDDADQVAQELKNGMQLVRDFRKSRHDAYNFNWLLHIEDAFQHPFHPTHANMRSLNLHRNQPSHQLAANMRRAFSGVVAGNVKADGVREIEKHGSFEIHGDPAIMGRMDELLASFVSQGRMKISAKDYEPCYRLVSASCEHQ